MKQLAESHGFTVAAQPEDAGIIASIGSDGSFLQAVRKTGFRDDCLYVGIAKKGKPICTAIFTAMNLKNGGQHDRGTA